MHSTLTLGLPKDLRYGIYLLPAKDYIWDEQTIGNGICGDACASLSIVVFQPVYVPSDDPRP
jgi:hypothetical protein